MASTVQLDLDHSRIKLGFHEGLSMPEIYESVAEHLPKLKSMEIREDDFVLCTYPKSGTHWLYRVIDMLQRGQAVYDKRITDSVWLDVQQIDRMAQLDSPRLLVAHVPFDCLPQQILDKRAKIVHVYRNPLAVLVSMHFQIVTTDSALKKDESEWSLDNMADMMVSGQLPYTGWFNYMNTVNEYSKANPDQPILHVSYEDMTAKPLETVTKLAEFLGKTASPALYADIVDACSFKKQKESEESADSNQAAFKFYRKGDKDDWKNHLTVAVHEKFQQILKDRASHCPFSAEY